MINSGCDAQFLYTSKDFVHWTYEHNLYDYGSECPDFFPLPPLAAGASAAAGVAGKAEADTAKSDTVKSDTTVELAAATTATAGFVTTTATGATDATPVLPPALSTLGTYVLKSAGFTLGTYDEDAQRFNALDPSTPYGFPAQDGADTYAGKSFWDDSKAAGKGRRVYWEWVQEYAAAGQHTPTPVPVPWPVHPHRMWSSMVGRREGEGGRWREGKRWRDINTEERDRKRGRDRECIKRNIE